MNVPKLAKFTTKAEILAVERMEREPIHWGKPVKGSWMI